MSGDFRAALQELDDQLARQSLTGSEAAQLDARIEASVGRGRRWRWAWAPLTLTAVLACLVLWLRNPSDADEVAGFAVVGGTAELAGDGDRLTVSSGRASLQHAGAAMDLEVSSPATIRSLADGVAVERGKVAFSVTPSTRQRRVVVSGGVIVITGTRFEVDEQGSSGSVVLHEGGIEFHCDDCGRAPVVLRPGDSLAWPLAPLASDTAAEPADAALAATPPDTQTAEPAGDEGEDGKAVAQREPAMEAGHDGAASAPHGDSADAPPVSGPPVAVAAADETDAPASEPASEQDERDLMARVQALRSRGRFAEAEALLAEAGANEELSAARRERISYERGALLTRQLDDRERACAHWRQHQAEFPDGRYAGEIGRAVAALGCSQ